MTPKSLLRHPMCISRAEDFTDGSTFHRVLWDDAQKGNSTQKLKADDKIKRVVLCSGKVYYDLLAQRDVPGGTRQRSPRPRHDQRQDAPVLHQDPAGRPRDARD